MKRKKTDKSFSFIKGFRRKRRAVRILAFLAFLLFLNVCCGQFIYQLVGNSLISLQVEIHDLFARSCSAYEHFKSVFHGTINDELAHLKSENDKLQLEINQLKQVYDENLKLQDALNLQKQYAGDIVMAEVTTIFAKDFARVAVINTGSKLGVDVDDVVVNKDGLIGRIIESHENWSKALLITDVNFNMPTKIGEQGVNVIVSGDNAEMLKVSLCHENIPLNNGDKVVTSEYSSVFDAQIPVGVIVKNGQDMEVKPYADLKSIKYVGVIKKRNKRDAE